MTDDLHIIRKSEARYPELLRQITDPPTELHCRGNVALLNSLCIAVVGTRKASDYGQEACADIAGHLAANGVTIVSGLAFGIDATAHQAALDAKGATIAVLGTGIENISPHGNRALGERIIASGGLVVSEYSGSTGGTEWTFPQRNRIISGLSRGVLVVEADRESGSLITAKSALDQNRDVFAVPGSIYWPRSVGTNWLIQQGAKPILNGADIMETLRMTQPTLPEDVSPLSTQDPVQEKILAILKSDGPTHLDAIVAHADCETSKVMATIALLELHGRITHRGNGIYSSK